MNWIGLVLITGYDPTCNPTVFTEFSSAAFRFGHSLLKEQFKRMGANFVDRKSNVKLRDVFMNPGNYFASSNHVFQIS